MFLRIDLENLPRVTMMGQVRQPMGWENSVSSIGPNVLILVRQGDMTFSVDKDTHMLTSGCYVVIPDGCGYHVCSREGCQYTFIHFQAPLEPVKDLPDDPFPAVGSKAFPYTLPIAQQDHAVYLPSSGRLEGEQEKIWPMLTECDMYRHALSASRKLRIDLQFAQMLALLDARSVQADRAGYPSVLSRMLMYIHEHYTEAITLSSLSQDFGLSRQYVMRLFQKHMHTTVTHYITQLKLSHALELLRHSTFRVGEVAEILGYANTYYFCRQFSQQFGMTPTEYIRNGIHE
ncbi:MAG: helix-turn-helix domain-containing protein [Clostridia bacterium]|nr:helix-turn-helix domain-containing protein [Clostridia bacterium]